MKTIKLPENLTKRWVEDSDLVSLKPNQDLTIDMSDTRVTESFAIALLRTIVKRYSQSNYKLAFKNVNPEIEKLIGGYLSLKSIKEHRVKGDFVRGIGETGFRFINLATEALSVLVEMIYWGTIGMFKSRDMRKGVIEEQMYQLGFRATGIVVLMSFLIGTVLSIQAVMQLRQFGADVFLVAMITWSMVREMGPLMTAIILAGRSGSATTAEIATMCVQEEVDALKTMGLNHIQFIVVPKFWAATFTMPVLALLAIVAGIGGGFVVAIFYVGLTPSLFWSEMVKNIFIKDFIISFFKSIVFAWLIIWIGTYYGFKVKGGAEEVGRETTNSVVASIFIIILADALFSFIYNIQF